MNYRQRADLILALSFICFFSVFWYWCTHEVTLGIKLALFVFQSALIGSIADWFAVTALFEKPLGFPWHTELVHTHRNQIIDGMTQIVSEKLLQPHMWREKLYKISFVETFNKWLDTTEGRERFRNLLYEGAKQIYTYTGREDTQETIIRHIRDYLKRQPLLTIVQDRFIALLEDEQSHLLDDGIGLLKEGVATDGFRKILEQSLKEWLNESKTTPHVIVMLNRFTGMVDMSKIAADVQSGLLAWLTSWEKADPVKRQWLCRKLEMRLYSMNGQLTYTVQSWQDRFVDSLPIEKWFKATYKTSQSYFATGPIGKEKLQDLLESEFMNYLDYCNEHPEIKQWLDDQIRRCVEVVLEHEHSLIGVAVREVLSGFDKRKFNEFLENKVGEDLAWIRINGALVGSVIGLLVFGFVEGLYAPHVAPFIRAFFLS